MKFCHGEIPKTRLHVAIVLYIAMSKQTLHDLGTEIVFVKSGPELLVRFWPAHFFFVIIINVRFIPI